MCPPTSMSVGHSAHSIVQTNPTGGYVRRQISSQKDAIVVFGGRRLLVAGCWLLVGGGLRGAGTQK